MSTISVDYDVLNQRGSPAWYSDVFASIPTPGYKGRMFISTDTFAFYRDTGTGWDLIGGPGIGTLTGSGVVGQVSFFNGTQVLAGNNNLFWDNTNSRLGINTTTPGQPLDIHSTGNTLVQLNNTTTANSNISFQNQNVAKWRVGNVYNAGANSFDIQNAGLSTNAISISSTTNNVNFGSTIGNGTFTYTLPGATGTLALTSDLTGYVTLATTQTITGEKTFSSGIKSNAGILIQNGSGAAASGYLGLGANTNELQIALVGATHRLLFTASASYIYTFPSATGTIALTSDLSSYLPLAGGTLTGALNGTSAVFSGNLTIDTNTLFVDSTNNRVGIGTITPTHNLEIANASGSVYQKINADFGIAYIGMETFDDTWRFVTAQATPIVFYTNNAERMRITSAGEWCLGTTAAVGAGLANILGNATVFNLLSIQNTNSVGNFIYFMNANGTQAGNIVNSSGGVLYLTSSDYRLKQDFKDYNGLDLISKIKTYDYELKCDNSRMYGVMAHELQEIISYAVNGKKDGKNMQGVDYSKLVPIIIKAIQEINIKLLKNNIN